MVIINDLLFALTVALTFGVWGWLLAGRLTDVGMALNFLVHLFPPDKPQSKPIWECAVCAAGFQSAIACAALYYFDYLLLIFVFPVVVLAMGIANYLEKNV